MTKNEPLISVLIPVYNTGEYLAGCLDSIAVQSYRNLEIIAVNDGSTDDSLAVLEEYARRDSRLRVIDKPNEGVMLTRERALAEAAGEYIFFIDSDDWIDADLIEKLYRVISATDYDIVSGEAVRIRDTYRSLMERDTPDVMESDRFLFHLLRHDVFGSVWGRLYHRRLFDNVSFFPGVSLMDDYIINLQIAMRPDFRGICFVPDTFYYYLQHNSSIIHQRIGFAYLEKFIACFDSLFTDRPDLSGKFRIELIYQRMYCYHMYLKRSGNPWMGNRPLAVEIYNEVKANRRELRTVAAESMIRDVLLYRHRWLRPAVMVSSVLTRWKNSIEKRTKRRHTDNVKG